MTSDSTIALLAVETSRFITSSFAEGISAGLLAAAFTGAARRLAGVGFLSITPSITVTLLFAA